MVFDLFVNGETSCTPEMRRQQCGAAILCLYDDTTPQSRALPLGPFVTEVMRLFRAHYNNPSGGMIDIFMRENLRNQAF